MNFGRTVMAMTATGRTLSRRALNRAFLARQFLLSPSGLGVHEVVEHLVGLQAQAPGPPYYGLWSRLRDFDPGEVSDGLTGRSLVRGTLWRGTIHLLTDADYLAMRGLVQPMLERILPGTPHGRQTADVDRHALAEAARTLLDERPLTNKELGECLARRWPGYDPGALGRTAAHLVALVQPPPRGLWGHSGQAKLSTPKAWLGRDADPAPGAAGMVRRYLAAFGPASVADVQAWSGVRALREVVDGLRGELVVFADENGREVFDLPDAARPDQDMPAPPAFVAEFDNLLLGHADRTRVISDEYRRRLFPINGVIPGAILVDGFVRGKWKLAREKSTTALVIEPYARLTKKDTAALSSKGERMLAFCAADATAHDVRFEEPG